MKPNIAFSCVVDNAPKFRWQCTIFVNTLIHLADVDAKQIFVHMIEPNLDLEAFLLESGVNIISAQRWGDGKYCNKLSQFDTPELSKADFVFLCDCDLAFAGDVRSLCSEYPGSILGKTVDSANPPLNILEGIFKKYSIKIPDVVETFSGDSFITNFNGGFLGIPGDKYSSFGKRWRYYACQLLEDKDTLCALDKWSHHVDQISFAMALTQSEFSFHALSTVYNTPTHSYVCQKKCNESLHGKAPLVLHYHSSLNYKGLIKTVGSPLIDDAVDNINKIISKKFYNNLFWEYLYSTKLESGIALREKTVPLRRKILAIAGVEDTTSMLDIGFGDLEAISPFKIDTYTGVEISHECIKLAKEKRPESKYYHYSEKDIIEPHDFVLCFDVLIYQSSSQSFYELVDYLVNKTKRRLVVSGYIRKPSLLPSTTFFYRDLEELLRRYRAFTHIQSIPLHKDECVIIADKFISSVTPKWSQCKQQKPSLFVHIGSPKTGSTAIQEFIKNNRQALEVDGITYPKSASKAMNYLAFSLLDTVPELVHQLPVDMNELYADIDYGNKSNIISSEAFFLCSTRKYLGEVLPSRLKLLLPDAYNVKIILYLRRQDNFIASIYAQYVKLHAHNNFYTKTIQEFIEEYSAYMDYYEILNNWSRVFGKENIIVRAYEKHQLKDEDIVSDFISTLGLSSMQDYKSPADSVNPAIGRDELEFKRLINILSINSNIKTRKIPELLLQRSVINKYFQEQSFLSPSERLKILDKYDDGNQRIAKEFLGRKNGKLFLDALPSDDEPWQPYEGLTKEMATSIFSFIKVNSPELFTLITEAVKKDSRSADDIVASTANWLHDCF